MEEGVGEGGSEKAAALFLLFPFSLSLIPSFRLGRRGRASQQAGPILQALATGRRQDGADGCECGREEQGQVSFLQ